MKKGITEMLILAFLSESDLTTTAIVKKMDECSGGYCKIIFPYASIYRLLEGGYIIESGKRFSEKRRRQFYSITDEGREYYSLMRNEYSDFISGVNMIFACLDEKGGNTDD